MRKEYRKAVADLFRSGLAEAVPGFEPVKVKAQLLFGGESVFRWAPCEDFHVYLLLVPSPQGHQAFTLEIGWSTSARFPDLSARPSIILGPDDPEPLKEDEGIVRLGGIHQRDDLWWKLPDPAVESHGSMEALMKSVEPMSKDEAMRDARPRVEEALDVLMGGGVPFVERLADHHCGRTCTPRRVA